MGIEQRDNENRAREKQEKKQEQKALDFFESKKLQAETSNLLQGLAEQIAEEFWIDILEVKKLISSSTLGDLDNLKSWISNKPSINLSDLRSAINNAKWKIEVLSKRQIDSLKSSLDGKQYSPETHKYITSNKVLPDSLLQKAYNPQNMGDQLIGMGVGIFDSTEAVILFVYGLGKWILLTPYHIYLMLTGKWEYDGFKNI